jgi:hypothetical protein
MDLDGFKAWLGEEAGEKGFTLPDNVVAAMAAAFRAGVIEEGDVPEDDSEWSVQEMKDSLVLWKSFYADGAKAAKIETRQSDLVKLERWLTARFGDSDQEEVASKKDVPTPQMLDDMKAQGARSLEQLGFIELALATGRAPALAETAGFAYMAPWSKMDGGKYLVKYNQVHLDTKIDRSDMEAINSHFTNLADKLMNLEDDPLAHKLAARVLTHWQDARKLRSSKAVLFYMKQFRLKYLGRGLPVTTDRDLMTEAMSAQMAGDLNESTTTLGDLISARGKVQGSRTSSEISSQVSSQIGGSVSEVESKMMTDQLAEVLSAVTSLSSELGSLKNSMNDLRSAQGNLASKVGALKEEGKGRKCWRCGGTDHEIKDCPEPPKTKQ